MKFKTLLISAISALVASVLVVGAQVPGVNSTLASVFTLAYEASTSKATYSATGALSPATNATEVCTLSGSASKTIRLRRIMLAAGATAVATDPIEITKRSSVNIAAGGVALSKVPYDSSFAASTVALAEAWPTTVTTLGTLVGVLADPLITYNNYTTGVGSGNLIMEFGRFGSPVFLRGVSQYVSVNMAGVVPAGVRLACTFEWTEDTDS